MLYMQWYIYILLCTDGSYYVGHTQNVQQRLVAHNEGQGAIYTKNRRPVKVVYSEPHTTHSEAIARERQLKRWSRAKKQALIAGDREKLHLIARASASRPENGRR